MSFDPQGPNSSCWITNTDNSAMADVLYWDGDIPPSTDGIVWKFTAPKATLKSINFTSDHKVLTKNPTSGSVWGDSSTIFSAPAWVTGSTNNPISQTMNTPLSATIKVNVQPAGINFNLVGTAPDNYMCFTASGQALSTGSDQDIAVTASANLPNQICTISESINWTINVGASVCPASSSGSHKIYVTYGTPFGSAPTEQRISWACTTCTGYTALDDIVLTASAYINTHSPPVFNPNTDQNPPGTPPIWELFDPSVCTTGGACIAYANLLGHIVNILGIPGGSLAWVYASDNNSFDSPKSYTINSRTCTVVVVTQSGTPNRFEGCLLINGMYYPGAMGSASFASPHDVHAHFAAWPNRLVYMTTDSGITFYFDKNFSSYTNPLNIPQSACIPVP